MIQSLYLTESGCLEIDLTPDVMRAAVQDGRGLLWVDLSQEPIATSESVLGDVFGFHPLAVEDALEETHVPRVDDWGSYLYIALHTVRFHDRAQEPLATAELDAFLGANYLVTCHTEPVVTMESLWSLCVRDTRHLKRGSGYLLYRVIDEIMNHYMPVVEGIDNVIDAVEDQIFGAPTSDTLQQIFTMKRSLLQLRRVIGPQREVLNRLARGDYTVIAEEDRIFFRDVYDHLVRLHEVTESLRDLTSSALDMYLSVVNNRMNEVVKVLTVITTLFMPLSFLAGFFGMNFFQPVAPLDAWTGPTTLGVVLVAMVVAPAAMAVWMRRRGWL